jgi:hypothetical protein
MPAVFSPVEQGDASTLPITPRSNGSARRKETTNAARTSSARMVGTRKVSPERPPVAAIGFVEGVMT